MGAAQLLRLARLVGRDEFYARTGLSEGAAEPDAGQRLRLSALVSERIDSIAAALAAEAVASDDVTSVDSALQYAIDGLDSLAGLVAAEQRAAILRRFREAVAGWDEPGNA